ncbi:Hypothetical protein NCS54_01508500 [Fusarium falciforme]|uniref:Hypothetical protein n=1 Tax=Fusarium falciforme TaxID=195108 RepID=UPI00230057EC|nr:Hypothetical protein NCS54_01508500 [Fusarium falciforme]WAO97360.1 Hypothetical protein NCS54_01508500 [Fusarium falciforme]
MNRKGLGAAVQRTTLEEYLGYCHEHLFKSLQISDDLLLTKSSDSTTSVDAKYYPFKLRPWEDFLGSQRTHYDVIREVLNGTQLLPSLSCDDIAFPIEYKAAHKIGVQVFEAALQKEDLFDQVLSNVLGHKLSTGHDRDNDRGDEKVAKALAQIFHFMVCCRSTFGYLTRGHSLIFLRIDEDAQVLYHHMVQPDKDVDGQATDLFFTGVTQLSAFCLKSFLEPRKTKEWLLREQASLQTWPNPYPEMREPTAEGPPSSPKAPSTVPYIASSPSAKNEPSQSPPVRLTRSSRKDIELVGVGSGPGDTDSDEDHHSDDAGIQPSMPEAVSGSKKRKKGISDSEHFASTDGSSFKLDAQQYCTQACLWGLIRRDLLDEKCPNVALHRSPEGGSRHHIDIREFIQLLNAQIGEACYRYRYCQPMDGKYGARGQLFKLSLRKHGYTFVGKGTFAAALPSIKHESEVYSRLNSVQGHVVPVYLGSADLQTPCPLPMAFIVHMLLLSWGGDRMPEGPCAEEQQESLKRLLLIHGVSHNDMRNRNMLWNEECGAVMLIDFYCGTMQLPAKHKQISRLSGKRKRRASDTGVSRHKAIPSSRLYY